MPETKEKKAKPKATPWPISMTRRLAWMAREQGKAPFLCRSYHLSESGFKF